MIATQTPFKKLYLKISRSSRKKEVKFCCEIENAYLEGLSIDNIFIRFSCLLTHIPSS
jgi:hypothetical protein